MLKVGITGGIGSGKSIVSKIFESFGIPVYYADKAAKELMHDDKQLRNDLITHFGSSTYTNDILNRKYLAEIVFSDKEKLALLNSLTHPAIIRHANEWMSKQKTPYAVKEAALLIESGASAHLDYVIGIYAPENIRISRVAERDGLSYDEIKKRITNQMDEELKMKGCDFVIMNDEHHLVVPQVIALHEKLLNIATR
jgi:dephospho-CoA kinase